MPQQSPSSMFPSGRIAIADPVVRHTVQDLMVQEQRLTVDCSCIRMFESHEATVKGVSAFNDGVGIIFAPGAFQPDTPNGRALIKQQLNLLLPPTQCPAGPIPVPHPNLSLSSSAMPSCTNILFGVLPGMPTGMMPNMPVNTVGITMTPSPMNVLLSM